MAKGKYKKKRIRKQLRECSVKDSGLSTRVVHLLENAGIKTMADLMRETDESLSSISGIGDSAMDEIRQIKNKVQL